LFAPQELLGGLDGLDNFKAGEKMEEQNFDDC
jgi:hypothetical protein